MRIQSLVHWLCIQMQQILMGYIFVLYYLSLVLVVNFNNDYNGSVKFNVKIYHIWVLVMCKNY